MWVQNTSYTSPERFINKIACAREGGSYAPFNMELSLQLICQCDDSVLAQQVADHIGSDALVLEEDIEFGELKVFRALEYAEETVEYFVNDCDIGAIWTLGRGTTDETEERVLAFHKAGEKKY
jgi:hypothetical protein